MVSGGWPKKSPTAFWICGMRVAPPTITTPLMSSGVNRASRKARGISQEELADLAGLHRTYVGSIERGERNVSIDNIERLAGALRLDVIDLLVREQGERAAAELACRLHPQGPRAALVKAFGGRSVGRTEDAWRAHVLRLATA